MFVNWALRSVRDTLIQTDPLAAVIAYKGCRKIVARRTAPQGPIVLEITPLCDLGRLTFHTTPVEIVLLPHPHLSSGPMAGVLANCTQYCRLRYMKEMCVKGYAMFEAEHGTLSSQTFVYNLHFSPFLQYFLGDK